MISTSARLLHLVALLAARPSWTCGELAARLAVTERTVRRDIARLRELGYGVESEPGPWGGYRLGVGRRMPPLALDEEEALAVAVALREAAFSGVLGGDQAALSALLKLRQVLPGVVAERLGAMDAALVHVPGIAEPQIAPGMLLDLAAACRRGERARLSYRDRAGRATVREVDPYRLVRAGRRWYLVARDAAKDEWRTFRGDRVQVVEPTGRPATPAEPPDPGLLVSRARAAATYPVHAVARLAVPPERAARLVPDSVGTRRADGPDATVVEVGGPDADGLACYLLRLGVPLRVLSPESVREALVRRLGELYAANAEEPEEPEGAGRR
ncbi:YafY family transcriptional regulator [Streptomonospora sp. S1-112]|uniref:YafY family transcriptional regulator n=1 Tax=Streptomonospora mangrovi TaxID=2883123 RepID=A0A9X3NN33_9ACTN|nr:YafY family protein [Streptomonospora mangrovi]MDA0563555.1 YafY family transcriptional regulator [Streptomonospora mangrovi]